MSILTKIWFIPLRVVCAKYHGATRDSPLAEFAERNSMSPDEMLNWYGYWIGVHHKLPIFGRFGPQTTIVSANAAAIGKHVHFFEGATVLRSEYLYDYSLERNVETVVFDGGCYMPWSLCDLMVRRLDIIRNHRNLIESCYSNDPSHFGRKQKPLEKGMEMLRDILKNVRSKERV